MNPIKTLRLNIPLTQLELATLGGNSKQTIQEAESGLYAKCPPSIVSVLSDASGLSRQQVQNDYQDWIREQRKAHGWEFDRIDLSELKSFRAVALAVGGSVKGFCRVIAVQPSIVNGYINQGYRSAHLTQALLDCGLSEGIVGALMKLPRT